MATHRLITLYLPTPCSWGEFHAQITITFVPESQEKPIKISHYIRIHQWQMPDPYWDPESGLPKPPAPPAVPAQDSVHAWQYDEIVFNDPFQSFLSILTQHPPTPLPKAKRRPVPFHTAHPASLEASRGGVPEFTQEMEREEAERLETARKAVIAEQDKWRQTLIEKERELEKLHRRLAEA